MKAKIKDKNAEIEVLKEMVKSANMQAKAKDIDVNRLQKKINRRQNGGAGGDQSSNYGGSRRGRDDGSVSSRQSRINANGVSPHPQNHNNLHGLDGTIPERDAMLEETGVYDYGVQQRKEPVQSQQPSSNMPALGKSKRQEWEEAVELDRMLEAERNAVSKQKLQSN